MALCNSGAMSMGGSTVGRSINCELGCSGTAQISLDDADVRNLAGVSSGAISMDDFYGASAGPSVFGEAFDGGFYMGTICAAGSCYFLIMAPNATGCAICQWKYTSRFCDNIGNELCDGYGNTYDHLNDSLRPAGNWTATRSIGGFSDWYLPALLELDQLYNNKACSPAGEGFADPMYWSSTECGECRACGQSMQQGAFLNPRKADTRHTRAVRRVSF